MKFYTKNQVMFSLMNDETTKGDFHHRSRSVGVAKGDFHHRSRSVGVAGLHNLSLATDSEGARNLVE
jgi:hypothetical protein